MERCESPLRHLGRISELDYTHSHLSKSHDMVEQDLTVGSPDLHTLARVIGRRSIVGPRPSWGHSGLLELKRLHGNFQSSLN